ncbi:MAG: chromophore lyase CpcT/CpeT [Cyanobacteria bacterium P01_F01_bin.86]
MTHATDVVALARWMAADFSNQQQALDNPPLFAHIRVCMRPLPYELLDGMSLYLEQAYDFMLKQPYRARVMKLFVVDDRIEIANFMVKDEETIHGAARDPDRLNTLTRDRLEKSSGCNMHVIWTGHSFKGRVEPGKACVVVRKGQTTYLDNEFEIDEQGLLSWDRGRDPETDEQVWGTLAGPFQFRRRQSYQDEVPLG